MAEMIPRRMHFVWLGAMPKWVRCNIEDWRAAQPDYDLWLHVDDGRLLPQFRLMFDSCECVGDQAELLQYSVLQSPIYRKTGGWVLHCDTSPMFPGCLDKLAEQNPITTELLVQGDKTSKYPDVWCMASTPECAAWGTINKLLPGQRIEDHKIARYGAKMLRAIEHNVPGVLRLADVCGYVRHEFRGGWKEPAAKMIGEGAHEGQ